MRIAGAGTRLLAVGVAVLVAGLVAALVLITHRSSAPAACCSSLGASPTPHDPLTPMDTQQRVVDILTQMHEKAFNPAAPPAKNSAGMSGGLFINWAASWDGDLASAASHTNFQGTGQTDSQAGAPARHDVFTDLVYLRDLLAFRAAHPGDQRFASDIARMEPVVRSDFAKYSYYKCNLYSELEDMQRFDPAGGWGAMADSFARKVYTDFYQAALGMVVASGSASERVDYAAACAVALTQSGMHQHDSAMTSAGVTVAQHIVRNDVDPTTHLLPLQVSTGGTALDTVLQAQVKMGDEAQALDSLLTMYELTHDRAYLTLVQGAVSWLFASTLHDRANGGFYFSIDYNGQNLDSRYKESRQAWMLGLLEHLSRLEPGRWTSQVQEMVVVVRDKLWAAVSDGYLYRVTPQFTVYVTRAGPAHSSVAESWVTSEAMDIACQVLEG